MKREYIIWLILLLLFIGGNLSAQDTVKVYVTEWDFIKVTRDTTFTQTKAGLALLETPNNEEWEVVVLYKKKVIVPPTPVITTVEDKDLTYSAGWETVFGLGWSVSHSSTVGATAKYSFTGNKVEVVADLAPGHGKMGYTINSGTEKFVDLYKDTRLNGQTVISELVPAGFNTISFRVISATVLIDKLIITR